MGMRLAVMVSLVALTIGPARAEIPCEPEYRAVLDSLSPSQHWLIQRAWATYATGRAESSDVLSAEIVRLRKSGELPRAGRRADDDARELLRCVRTAPPLAVVSFTIRAFTGSKSEPRSHVQIAIDGEFVGSTDDTGSADFVATPRLHVITATEQWGNRPVSHLVDLSDGSTITVDFDLSRDWFHLSDLSAACLPFKVRYFLHSLGSLERAVVVTPEAVIPVDDLFRVSADGASVEPTNCHALFERLRLYAPPHVLYLDVRAGGRYESRIDLLSGQHVLSVNAVRSLPNGSAAVRDESISIRRAGSDQELFRAMTDSDGVAVFEQLPSGDYILAADGYGHYARARVRVEGDRNVDLHVVPTPVAGCRRESTAPSAAAESGCEGQRDAYLLLFRFDAAERIVPWGYWRVRSTEDEMNRASEAGVERTRIWNSYPFGYQFRKNIEAELVDRKGRLTFQALGSVQLALEAPGGGWFPIESSFTLELPAGSSRTLRLRGWLPQMDQTFDLEELSRDPSLRP